MYKELRVDTALLVKSIHDEAVRKIREDFQHLDMGIFDHILSGRTMVRFDRHKLWYSAINGR